MSNDTVQSKRRGVFQADVLANEQLCDEHFCMVLGLASFPATAPGQFVQLMCRPPGEPVSGQDVQWADGEPPQFTQAELTARQAMLRRPFSIAGRRDGDGGAVQLEIIYRTIGAGTHWLSEVAVGSPLSVLGPLGNGFDILPDKPVAALIGGGVGIPPMLYLAEALTAAGKQTVAFSGARSASLLPLGVSADVPVASDGTPAMCIAEFAARGASASIATDDGTLGLRGFVSEIFQNWLDSGVNPADVVVYSCGPEVMMRVIGQMCIARGITCRLSLERTMACGMGTCQSCVCKLKADGEQGWAFKLCCTDGPVFDAAQIVWD